VLPQHLHRANKSDTLTLRHLLDTASKKTRNMNSYSALMADKGYDSSTCRSICTTHNLQPLIPKRGTNDIYRGRYVIEQTFGILDQFRRIRVRYETLIRNFKSFHCFGFDCG
jgi:IS5 family transposase